MKKYVILIVTLSLFMLSACSLEPPEWAKSTKDGKKKDMKIGLSISTLNNPFFVTVKTNDKNVFSRALDGL